jgi:hypothetical protein
MLTFEVTSFNLG